MVGVASRLRRLRDRSSSPWLALPVGGLAAAGVLAFAPLPTAGARMLAITGWCVCLWVGTPVPPWLTGLAGIGAIGAVFSTELALVGFQSPATWLILLGIVLGEATRRSGLATAIERAVLSRMPDAVQTDARAAYRYLLAAFSLVGVAFIFLVPSALVRVLVLGPILVSVGERFTDRRARLGLFLGPLFVTFYGAAGVLTGALGNIIITGIAESVAGVSVGWVEWLVWMAPVMTVGRSAAIAGLAYVLYRPSDSDALATPDETSTAAIDGDARRMLGFLLVGVAIWATDVIHGLHPLYGALVVTVLVLLPRVGVVDLATVREADFSIVFFLGAIFAIAEGLQRTAFTDVAAATVLSAVPADASLVVVLGAVSVVSVLLTFVMEGLAVASVVTPVLVSFARDAGIALTPVVMVEAVSLISYFFPYQSAVLVGMVGLDVAGPREIIRMAVACSLITLGVLLPVQILIFALLW